MQLYVFICIPMTPFGPIVWTHSIRLSYASITHLHINIKRPVSKKNTGQTNVQIVQFKLLSIAQHRCKVNPLWQIACVENRFAMYSKHKFVHSFGPRIAIGLVCYLNNDGVWLVLKARSRLKDCSQGNHRFRPTPPWWTMNSSKALATRILDICRYKYISSSSLFGRPKL